MTNRHGRQCGWNLENCPDTIEHRATYPPLPRRSFTFAMIDTGKHVHIQVRCGIEGQRALLGNLIMSAGEWDGLRAIISNGSARQSRDSVEVAWPVGLEDGGGE